MNAGKIFSGLLIFFAQTIFAAHAGCAILNSTGAPVPQASDALARILHAEPCPRDVLQLRQALQHNNLALETHMVANRGFHNPAQGSFSFFESVSGQLHDVAIQPGDFFFGHFTTVDAHNYLVLDQAPEKNALMIEAFAWDKQKGVYNFYELRGDGKQGQWFYRGDSKDIYADNQTLHLQADPAHPQFGARLRCSGCHGAGGPIMKELHAPHNDWWQDARKLDFGGRVPDKNVKMILDTLLPASNMATRVVDGLRRLNADPVTLSLPEQLRPLFCPVEVNFASDIEPNENKKPFIAIPVEFFIDSRLLSSAAPILISRKAYEAALLATNSHFPETNDNDADHAWLTPVKATSDKMAVDALIKKGVIDEKFMLAVLALDMTNPVFSQQRCRLLRYVPQTASVNWQTIFIADLKKSNDIAAQELAQNLNHSYTATFYREKADAFIKHCNTKLQNALAVKNLYDLLLQRRVEIRASEISANPKGQILEPGFRVIFPKTNVISQPGALSLSSNCDISA